MRLRYPHLWHNADEMEAFMKAVGFTGTKCKRMLLWTRHMLLAESVDEIWVVLKQRLKEWASEILALEDLLNRIDEAVRVMSPNSEPITCRFMPGSGNLFVVMMGVCTVTKPDHDDKYLQAHNSFTKDPFFCLSTSGPNMSKTSTNAAAFLCGAGFGKEVGCLLFNERLSGCMFTMTWSCPSFNVDGVPQGVTVTKCCNARQKDMYDSGTMAVFVEAIIDAALGG